jgi:MATE family multidrug resistance protein
MLTFSTFRAELRPTLRLALPLVLAEVGWMSMNIVDTMMVGRLPNSAVAISAVSISSNLFHVLAFFGEGILIGLDTLVSQSFGAGHREDCYRSLINGVYLTLLMTPILTLPIFFFRSFFERIHVETSIIDLAIPYTYALGAGMLPLLLYFAVRRSLQAMDLVRPVAFSLVTANIVNLIANYALIYGKWGFPAMGVEGSGWSTAMARLYMVLVLVVYLFWYDRRHHTALLKTPVDLDLKRIRHLLALGLPAATQMTVEIGVFALVAALIARLGPIALASHQIALNTVAFTFMIPLGISSAAAVRVGQALGRKDPVGAALAGNTAILLGGSFMFCMSVALVVFPRYIALMYTNDAVVIKSAIALLAAGAAFQLFDGIQTVATGALRGTGDTRTPMLCHFAAYWLIGLPLGIYLCFRQHWGALGLWVGLSVALILIGILLLQFWQKKSRQLRTLC